MYVSWSFNVASHLNCFVRWKVNEAQTLPKVLEMYANNMRDGKVRE